MAIRRRVRTELGLPISIGVARTKHLAKIASQVAKPDGLVVVDPTGERAFLHDLPVGLMWGVGPVTEARLAEIGVRTIGQLAATPGWSLERVLGPAAGLKLAALACNRDPRPITTHRRARSAGAQSALGRQRAETRVIRPTLHHLADRIATRLRAKSLVGRTVTVRVRFADLRAVTRAATLEVPIATTLTLAEIAETLVHAALAHHREENSSPCWRSRSLGSSPNRSCNWNSRSARPRGAASRQQAGSGARQGRPRDRHDPRALRLGGGRLRAVAGARRSVPARVPRVRGTDRERQKHRAARAGDRAVADRLPAEARADRVDRAVGLAARQTPLAAGTPAPRGRAEREFQLQDRFGLEPRDRDRQQGDEFFLAMMGERRVDQRLGDLGKVRVVAIGTSKVAARVTARRSAKRTPHRHGSPDQRLGAQPRRDPVRQMVQGGPDHARLGPLPAERRLRACRARAAMGRDRSRVAIAGQRGEF